MLAEEDPAGEVIEEIGAFQAIHHRSLDLCQMKADPQVPQVLVDRLEALERRHVYGVDRRTHEDDVPDFRVPRDAGVDAVFEKPGVGEIEAFIDPQRENFGSGLDGVAQDVAKVLGAGHAPHNRRMRSGCAVEEDQDRGGDAERNSQFHAENQRCAIRFALATFLAMATFFFFGAARSFFSTRPFIPAGFEMLLIGSVAAVFAYGVGLLGTQITGFSL